MKFRRMLNLFALSLCATVCLAGKAQATLLSFHANLDGTQEVPAVSTSASGSADLTLDDSTGAVTITSGSYSGLATSAAKKIQLFDGAFGTNGTLILPLFTDNNPGATTGTFSGGPTLNAGQITDMVNGNTYINIVDLSHTPTGEIRGQLLAVPEPSTMALGAIGLCSFLVARQRMRRKVA
jgi:CHRD domain/PEP-CTERM motif